MCCSRITLSDLSDLQPTVSMLHEGIEEGKENHGLGDEEIQNGREADRWT